MTERDNFTAKTKRILGDRVGYRCSCPTCRRLTIGPTKDISAPLLIAEAAHITAATAGGPRFNPNLTAEERRAVDNGIWLCAACHAMVDKDRDHFTNELLLEWKATAEEQARREVEGELIFAGYTDPAQKAEQHFKAQLPEFSAAHHEMGKEKGSAGVVEVPIIWLQVASASSLKGLVKLNPATTKQHLNDIKPVVCSSWKVEVSRFGVHVAGYGGESRTEKSLVQLFKDGSLVIGFVLFENTNSMDFGYDFTKSKTIPWLAVENRLFTSIGQVVKILKALEVQQPAFLRLVIRGLKGYGMAFDPSNWVQHHPVDADVVETSPSLVASFDLAATEIARPLLEEFWQYFGVWHSPSYNEKGEFVRKR